MAKSSNKARVIYRCPECDSTIFQGPFHRGEIVDGEFVARQIVFQCRLNHHEFLLEQAVPRPTMALLEEHSG